MNLQPAVVHFLAPQLLQQLHPITVNLIGAGGTGSHLLTLLADMSHTLLQTGHPGLQVQLFDGDRVNQPNIGRQRFSPAEVGLPKAVALIHRINRYYGFNWRAVPGYYPQDLPALHKEQHYAMITMSCVDTAAARFQIAATLKKTRRHYVHDNYQPRYWIDCGNSTHTGQVILSTVRPVDQPAMDGFMAVDSLPMITDEFGYLLVDQPRQPSCSTHEALLQQDLFINRSVAMAAARMVWQLLRQHYTGFRGVFLNLAACVETPLPVRLPVARRRCRRGKSLPPAAV